MIKIYSISKNHPKFVGLDRQVYQFSSLSNFFLNEIHPPKLSDKNSKNGIKENRGYTEKLYIMTRKNNVPKISGKYMMHQNTQCILIASMLT